VTLHPAHEIILHGESSVIATTFENKWFDVANLAWFKLTPLQNLTQILKGNTLRDDVDVRYYEGVEKILITGEI
jgi:hypothetical protein